MTTNKEVYEGKILETLMQGRSPRSSSSTTETLCVCNSERLAVVEQKIDGVENRLTGVENRLTEIEKLLGWLRIIGGGVVAIALSLIANFIYSILNTIS